MMPSTWHDFVAGVVAIIGIVGIVALALLQIDIPQALEILEATALTWTFGAAIPRAPAALIYAPGSSHPSLDVDAPPGGH